LDTAKMYDALPLASNEHVQSMKSGSYSGLISRKIGPNNTLYFLERSSQPTSHCDGDNVHGMQEVVGSNPIGSIARTNESKCLKHQYLQYGHPISAAFCVIVSGKHCIWGNAAVIFFIAASRSVRLRATNWAVPSPWLTVRVVIIACAQHSSMSS
jgi:hypothetical protein